MWIRARREQRLAPLNRMAQRGNGLGSAASNSGAAWPRVSTNTHSHISESSCSPPRYAGTQRKSSRPPHPPGTPHQNHQPTLGRKTKNLPADLSQFRESSSAAVATMIMTAIRSSRAEPGSVPLLDYSRTRCFTHSFLRPKRRAPVTRRPLARKVPAAIPVGQALKSEDSGTVRQHRPLVR